MVAQGPQLRRAVCSPFRPDRQRRILFIWEQAFAGRLTSRASSLNEPIRSGTSACSRKVAAGCSPGIVKTLAGCHGATYPEMAWEPKAAFTSIAECYRG